MFLSRSRRKVTPASGPLAGLDPGADLNDVYVKALHLIRLRLENSPPAEDAESPDPTNAARTERGEVVPLFNENYYIAEAAKAGISLSPGEDALLHWARYGVEARIVPTPHYDEEFYQAANPDVADEGLFGFLHYLEFGIPERRKPRRVTLSSHESEHVDGGELNEDQAKALYLIKSWMDDRPKTQSGETSFASNSTSRQLGQVGLVFDRDYYITEAAKAGFPVNPGEDAVLHWALHGVDARIVPTLDYDEEFYLTANPDIADEGLFGFLHYLEFGIREGRKPLPGTLPNQMTDPVASAGLNELQAKALRLVRSWMDNRPKTQLSETSFASNSTSRQLGQVGLVFDRDYYITEAAKAGFPVNPGEDAVLHWARYGVDARIVPTLDYDEEFYLTANPDIADEGLFGFLHYLEFGIREGRKPLGGTPLVRKLLREVTLLSVEDIRDGTFELRPGVVAEYAYLLRLLFSPTVYLGSRDFTLKLDETDAFEHFISVGFAENCPFSLLFDARVYAEGARRAGFPRLQLEDALRHWLTFGIVAHISPTGLFDEAYYLSTNKDVADANLFGFIHWLYFGRKDGRRPNDWMKPFDSELASALELKVLSGPTQKNTLRRRPKFPSLNEAVPEYSTSSTFVSHVVSRLRYFSPIFDDAHATIMVRFFVPSYYRQTSGLDSDTTEEKLFYHFLSEGMWDGISPSPLFDLDHYLSVSNTNNRPEDGELPPFLDWLIYGRKLGLTPTARFDPLYYLNAYHDVGSVDPFEHYALNGISENRAPNALFSPAWYEQQSVDEDQDLPAYLRFLLSGAGARRPPSLLASALTCSRGHPLTIEEFDSAARIMIRLSKEFSVDEIVVAMHLFVPTDVAALGDEWDEFIAFVSNLTKCSDYSSPLFDSEFYRDRAAEAGFPPGNRQSAILHFLRIGRIARIVPTKLFDEDFYVQSNPDFGGSSIWSFEHFIRFGIFEGRRPNRDPSLAIAPILPWRRLPGGARNRAQFWRGLINSSVSCKTPGEEADGGRVNRVLSSELMTLIMERARALEPQVGDINNVASILLAPQHDVTAALDEELRSRLKHDQYDTIVCIPWIRAGGADLVACQVAECLLRIREEERVLLLQIDHANVERPDWAPQGIEIVDVSDIAAAASVDVMQRLLYSAFVGLSPRRIININSRLCWTTYVRFGTRLAKHSDLYAYLFCWDHTSKGHRAGYPSDFFAPAAQSLTALFTDTDYLKGELTRIYMLPGQTSNKIVPLYSPARSSVWKVTAAELGATSSATRERPRILWAGRLDRQKRFDLVLQIATRMPEADFMCWGSPLLDAAPEFSLPSNVTLTPSFNEIDELPLGESDVWLFTSEWEGLPTILIELASRGVPIVASSVGGVPELIRPDMGWLIRDIEDVGLYVAALREAIEQPRQRVVRARRLRDHAASRHTIGSFSAALGDVLSRGRA